MRPRAVKAFLDTNIFVYTFDRSAPSKRKKAREIVAQALERHDAVISWQVVQEFLNVATRKFTHPMNSEDGRLYLQQVLMPLCEVFPSEPAYGQALSIAREAGFSFYDSLIVSSAILSGALLLFSEDLPHGQKVRGIEIRNPFRS